MNKEKEVKTESALKALHALKKNFILENKQQEI